MGTATFYNSLSHYPNYQLNHEQHLAIYASVFIVSCADKVDVLEDIVMEETMDICILHACVAIRNNDCRFIIALVHQYS